MFEPFPPPLAGVEVEVGVGVEEGTLLITTFGEVVALGLDVGELVPEPPFVFEGPEVPVVVGPPEDAPLEGEVLDPDPEPEGVGVEDPEGLGGRGCSIKAVPHV